MELIYTTKFTVFAKIAIKLNFHGNFPETSGGLLNIDCTIRATFLDSTTYLRPPQLSSEDIIYGSPLRGKVSKKIGMDR